MTKNQKKQNPTTLNPEPTTQNPQPTKILFYLIPHTTYHKVV